MEKLRKLKSWEIERKVTVLFILIILLATIVGGGYLYQILTTPSLEERKAALIEILSDGQYDETYSLLELKGNSPEELIEYVRPVGVALVDQNDTLLYFDVETGILVDNYVLTSPVLFQFLGDPEVQEMLSTGEIRMLIRILADVNQDAPWEFEVIEKPIRYMGSVVVLEREVLTVFPKSTKFPFGMGKIEDLNLEGRQDVLYGIGAILMPDGNAYLHTYQGAVEFIPLPYIIFSASIAGSEFGGPIFAIRDGEFELIGIVQIGGQGRVVAVDINSVFAELKQAGFIMEVEFEE